MTNARPDLSSEGAPVIDKTTLVNVNENKYQVVRPSWALKPGLTDRLVVGRKVTLTLTHELVRGVINIWSWPPDGARHQDRLTDWSSVVIHSLSHSWVSYESAESCERVLVRRPVSTCHRVNRRTRLRQRNCRESVSSEFGDSDWVCRSWALASEDSAVILVRIVWRALVL
jgi:hypothetical protein